MQGLRKGHAKEPTPHETTNTMTNKSDTPRCDENIVVSVYGEVRVPLEFARKLERERKAVRGEKEEG